MRQSIAAGVDVVAFSGDKLLGGPQAGLLAGRAPAIGRLRKHPLLRAVRLDKLCLAALEATLRLHAEGRAEQIPVWRMLAQSQAGLAARAARLASLIGPAARIEATEAFAGGGTLPAMPIPSVSVSIAMADAERAAARLRAQATPVICRIVHRKIVLDMMTVDDSDIALLAAAMNSLLAQ